MNEDLFLKSRQEREAARLQRSAAAPSDVSLHRTALTQELQRLAAIARDTGVPLSDRQQSWRELQQQLQSAADTSTLPPHDMKTWNKQLSDLSSELASLNLSNQNIKKGSDSQDTTSSSGTSSSTSGTITGTVGATGAKKFTFRSKVSATSASSSAATTMPTSSPAAAAPVDACSPPKEPQPPQQQQEDALVAGCGSSTSIYEDLHGAPGAPKVIFVASAKAVFVRRCSHVTVLALPTAGSFFVSDTTHSTLYVCTHQMRMKSMTSCDVYVWCSSIPVIEKCRDVRFGPYDAWVGLAASRTANFGPAPIELWATVVGEQQQLAHCKASHRSVDDFDWLKQSQSPNWSVIPPEKYSVNATVFTASATTDVQKDGTASPDTEFV